MRTKVETASEEAEKRVRDIRRLYAALKWRVTGRPATSGSGQPPIPLLADPRSGAGDNPSSPLPCTSSVFTHLNLPALSFALLFTPSQLSHFSLTQRATRAATAQAL